MVAMKMPQLVSLLALFLLLGCSEKSDKTAAKPSSPGSNPLNAPADYGNALVKGHNKAVSTIDIASLNQAVQMYQVQEGHNPKSLDELVQKKLIVRVPDAPYGSKLDYDPNTGVVKVVKVQ